MMRQQKPDKQASSSDTKQTVRLSPVGQRGQRDTERTLHVNILQLQRILNASGKNSNNNDASRRSMTEQRENRESFSDFLLITQRQSISAMSTSSSLFFWFYFLPPHHDTSQVIFAKREAGGVRGGPHFSCADPGLTFSFNANNLHQ